MNDQILFVFFIEGGYDYFLSSFEVYRGGWIILGLMGDFFVKFCFGFLVYSLVTLFILEYFLLNNRQLQGGFDCFLCLFCFYRFLRESR